MPSRPPAPRIGTGDEWLDALLGYLDGNRRLLAELVREHLPQAVLTPMEATYLGWLDLRAYGHDNETLMKLTHRAGVAFTGGTFFGQEAGDGFLRINIGCPARYVEEGILRLEGGPGNGGVDKARARPLPHGMLTARRNTMMDTKIPPGSGEPGAHPGGAAQPLGGCALP